MEIIWNNNWIFLHQLLLPYKFNCSCMRGIRFSNFASCEPLRPVRGNIIELFNTARSDNLVQYTISYVWISAYRYSTNRKRKKKPATGFLRFTAGKVLKSLGLKSKTKQNKTTHNNNNNNRQKQNKTKTT